MLLQVGVPLSARPRLHVVVPVQVVQGGLRDVDASVTKTNRHNTLMHTVSAAVTRSRCGRGGVTRLGPRPPSDWRG